MKTLKKILALAILLIANLQFQLLPSLAQPVITSFSPSTGSVGSTVIISGNNFNPVLANNVVYFGATRAPITLASSTSITAVVPSGATYSPITVTDISTGLTGYSSQPFIPTFTCGGAIGYNSFLDNIDIKTGDYLSGIGIADLDGDGKTDFAVGNYNSGYEISVFRNMSFPGSISFDSSVNFSTGIGPEGIVFGDLDGDGMQDMAVIQNSDNKVAVYKNQSTIGNISFAAKQLFNVGNRPYNILIGDIDGDGKSDLALANSWEKTISILRNTSSIGIISFATDVKVTTNENNYSYALHDLDQDGKPELTVNNFYANSISIFPNTSISGSITFASSLDYSIGGSVRQILIDDIDGDSKPDISITTSQPNKVSVFRNTSTIGNISMATNVDFLTGRANIYDVDIIDLDGDGKLDITGTSNYDYTNRVISIFKNISTIGTISLEERVDIRIDQNQYLKKIIAGDLDGDSKPDLLLTSILNGLNLVSVLKNNVSVLATYPGLTCDSGSVTINAKTVDGTVNWYNQSTGGVLIGTGNSLTSTDLDSTFSYFIEVTGGICPTLPRTEIKALIEKLTLTSSIVNVSCDSSKDGSASITVTNGRSPYTFSWNTSPDDKYPSISERNQGTYSVFVTDSNGCSATASVVITVEPPQKLPFFDKFSSNTLYNNPIWRFITDDSWLGWTDCATGISLGCFDFLAANNFEAGSGLNFQAITPVIDLSQTKEEWLSFDVSYSKLSDTTVVWIDTLKVLYSTDCGNTWSVIYFKYGDNLASLPPGITNFVPSIDSSSHWRRDSINLSFLGTEKAVQFNFMDISGYGNILFLKDIHISGTNINTNIATNTQDTLHFVNTGVDMVFSLLDTSQDTQTRTIQVDVFPFNQEKQSIETDTFATIFNNQYYAMSSPMTNFSVTIFIPYDSSELNTDDLNLLNLAYQISDTLPWKIVESIPFLYMGKIGFQTTHFSNWAIAITKPNAKIKLDTTLFNSTLEVLKVIKVFGNSGVTLQMWLDIMENRSVVVSKYDINPGGDLPDSVLSFLNTFWEIKINKTDTIGIYFNPDGVGGYNAQESDKYQILYRPDAITDWQVLPTMRVKKGMKEEFYIKNNNLSGHYILGKTTITTQLFSDSASVQLACAGDSVLFTSYTTNGQPPYTYQWSGESNFTSTEQNPKHVYSSMGVFAYKLVVEDAEGAITEFENTITIGCVGLEENTDNQISIFPNPSAGNNLQINLSNEIAGVLSIKIFDLVGREILEKKIVNSGNNKTFELNTSEIKNLKGSYFVVIDNGKKRYWKMVVVE